MTITDSIKAMPTIADANGDKCVSQAAVLALLEAKAEEWRTKAEWLDDGSGVTSCAEAAADYRRRAAELAGERLSGRGMKRSGR